MYMERLLNNPTVGMSNVADKLKGKLTTGKLWTFYSKRMKLAIS